MTCDDNRSDIISSNWPKKLIVRLNRKNKFIEHLIDYKYLSSIQLKFSKFIVDLKHN